jgi:hypothetical protein
MNSLQRNAGNFGIIAAVLLAVLFVLFLSSGLDYQAINDPTKALPAIAQNHGRWALTGVVGVLVVGFAVVFTAGLYRKLRDKAPTRAFAVLLFSVLGSGGFALSSLTQWLGGAQLAGTTDQVAANHAYVALVAVNQGLMGLGNTFVGAAVAVAGWAVMATQTMGAAVGWLGIVAGVVTAVLVFWPMSTALNFASFILIIIWLAWAGSQLRRA